MPSFSKWNSRPSSRPASVRLFSANGTLMPAGQTLGQVVMKAARLRVAALGRHAERMPAQARFDITRQAAQRARQLRHAQPGPGAGEVGDEIDVERPSHVSQRSDGVFMRHM